MKQIKKVVLKEATKLSQEEMKQVFGGSGAKSEKSSGFCYLKCGQEELSLGTIYCTKGCGAAPNDILLCVTDTTREQYWCENSAIMSSVRAYLWEV